MTQTDLNRGLCFFKSQVNRFGTLPGQILMRSDAFVDALSNDTKWSQRNSHLFTILLLGNKMLELRGAFLHLTTKGYAVTNGDESEILFIDLRNILFDPKNPVEKTFYLLWEIIGSHKDDNPFYVDGRIFYETVRPFIEGLPPSYVQDKGESTSRIEWCLKLFKMIPQKDIPSFLDNLSDLVYKRMVEKLQDKEFEANITNLEQDLEPIKEMDNKKSHADKKTKIFISHNTKDAEYAKALVQLLVNLGVNEEKDVFCSSLPGCGVKFGKSFIEEIKAQYENNELIMLFIHSPRYYDSHVSLCEMGAAWIMKNEHFSFLTKDCDFDMLDAVVPPSEIAFKAGQENTYHLLNDFKEFIERRFNLQPKSFHRWETVKSDFISATNNL
ncbi:MAG: toll/interleukin-1 receptor domain-containing protein [Lactobacillus sp.]|nr:toll/interleukin-1 receptor domain-containing protein [Lactobacillus sp.]